jgi:hypothetical protein
MKFSGIRWLFVVAIAGAGLAGVISSNVGCGGSDDGKAGSTGSAGSSGTGTAGTSGGGGSGGQKPLKLSYTFDTASSSDSMNWKLNDYIDATPAKNLGAYAKPDAGLMLTDPPVMEWSMDDSESSATSGSMKISVTFSEYGQYVDPVINLPAVVDLSNSTLTLKVRLLSGSFTSGGVQFHFSTTSSYTYSAGMWIDSTTFTNNSWKVTPIDTITAVPATAGAPWDPTQVIQVGIQITAGTMTTTSTVPSGRLVFEIDTVQAR